MAGIGAVTLIVAEPSVTAGRLAEAYCWVDDVTAAAARAAEAGATILREPTVMDFGMESAWAQIDGGPIVDLTKPAS